MSKVQTLTAFVNQRLTLAAEEILELFERTIAEYEEELCRQHKLLDAVFKPEVRLHRTDVQQLLVSKEKVLPQQKWSPLLDHEEPPELPHIKEELWSSQEGEQLQGLEEADITRVTFTPVPVKSEDDKEKPQSSQLHQTQTEQMKTEVIGEDCGGPEPARNFNPDNDLQSATHDEMSPSSEPETDDSCDWEETREPQTGSDPLQNNEKPVSNMKCNTGKTSVISSECATNKRHQQKQTGKKEGKRFSCSVCKKSFRCKREVERHMRTHTGEKPFSCSVCGVKFAQKDSLRQHMRSHTGEKPFSCSVCGIRFARKDHLSQHNRTHTGEKPFSCSVCGIRFAQSSTLARHLRLRTGEGPFTCSFCKATFCVRSNLYTHIRIHTGEKPFSCSVCCQKFALYRNLRQHLTVHMGEKPFSCNYCHKSFTELRIFKQHKCFGESSGSQ